MSSPSTSKMECTSRMRVVAAPIFFTVLGKLSFRSLWAFLDSRRAMATTPASRAEFVCTDAQKEPSEPRSSRSSGFTINLSARVFANGSRCAVNPSPRSVAPASRRFQNALTTRTTPQGRLRSPRLPHRDTRRRRTAGRDRTRARASSSLGTTQRSAGLERGPRLWKLKPSSTPIPLSPPHQEHLSSRQQH